MIEEEDPCRDLAVLVVRQAGRLVATGVMNLTGWWMRTGW
jgi:archaeosine-15-forming tRNA-guanine transglycosylase